MKEQDELLVQSALAGDRTAFGILVDQYKSAVFAYAMKMTRDFFEAQDLTQETFIEAYLKLQNLRQPTKFGHWLLGIAKNLCLKAVAQKQVLADLDLSLSHLGQEVTYHWIEEPENTESWELGAKIAVKLSREEKALLKSFYLHETPCREIAQQEGASEVSIRKRLSRTRQKLKTEFLKGGKNMNKMIAMGAIVTMLSAPVWAGTFRDSFDAGSHADGWEIFDYVDGGSIWTVENGELICRRSSLWVTTFRFGEPNWRNYSIEADAKMVGILSSAFHYMGFDLRLGEGNQVVWLATGKGGIPVAEQVWIWGVRADQVIGQQAVHARNPDFKPEMNRWYHLKAVAEEEHFEFHIDGERVVALDFPDAPTGAVALVAGGSITHFDNVVITGDDVPDDGSDLAAVSDLDKLTTTWGNIKGSNP